MTIEHPEREAPSAERVRQWLAREYDRSIGDVIVEPFSAGHSNGAWRLRTSTSEGPVELVLKVPQAPSVVHAFDPCREGRLVDALHRSGAPVPEVCAISRDDGVVGSPCFAMARIPGRSVDDAPPAGYHGEGWFRDIGTEARRAIWESFHDRLAELHRVETMGLDFARHGDGRTEDTLAYWRAALLALVAREKVPRQLAALDWLCANVPPDADEAPAPCLGDARLVNGIVDGEEVRALVDFEIGYVGNPAADLAYSLHLHKSFASGSADPIDDLPDDDETWERWGKATGRPTTHRGYWTAFGAMVICVTATRAIVQWTGGDGSTFGEHMNPLIDRFSGAVEEARV